MDIHNSIIHISIMDIHISIMDIPISNMDIHISILDIRISIMDIHNYRVYALFFRENINIHLHFMSSLHTDKTQVVEIPP